MFRWLVIEPEAWDARVLCWSRDVEGRKCVEDVGARRAPLFLSWEKQEFSGGEVVEWGSSQADTGSFGERKVRYLRK